MSDSPTNRELRTELALLHQRTAAVERLAEVLDELSAHVVDIKGKSGDNGKLGELRRSLDGIAKRIWWAVTVVVGSLGAAAAVVFQTGQEIGTMRTKVDQLRDQVRTLHSYHEHQPQFPVPFPPAPKELKP
jgi:hypothetical protein